MSLRIAAAGISVPREWRLGDLLVLQKVGSVIREVAPVLEERWTEVPFGRVRIKLRATDTEDMTSLVPGNVLDTVSRRDPVRQKIGFWTSGNRVYGLADPEKIGQLITLCNNDLAAMKFTHATTLDHANRLGLSRSTAERLFDVLLVELQEHRVKEGT